MKYWIALLITVSYLPSLYAKTTDIYSHENSKAKSIVVWHSLAGHSGEQLAELAAGFNRSQADYRVKLVYKGEYIETMTSFAAAFRAKQAPAIVQIFEVGTASMQIPSGIIKPVDEIMEEQGLHLPVNDFLPAIREFYSHNGSLKAMPFNVSIPVMYYNADVLSQLGYSAANFPRSWDEMEHLANQLKLRGYSCVYTTSYATWIQIEAFSSLHGLALLTNEQQRHDFLLQHLERLKRWQQKQYFEYGGRSSNAVVLFTSGHCPLYSESSGDYNSLSQVVPFHLGVAPLPLDTQISSKRHNNVIGGAGLWAVSGQPPDIYRGIAKFFIYLSQPSIQRRWHQQTGYLPLGTRGTYQRIQQIKNPVLAIAEVDLQNQESADKRMKCGPQNHIRLIYDEMLEEIFSATKTPSEALAEAEKRSNYVIMRFMRISPKF